MNLRNIGRTSLAALTALAAMGALASPALAADGKGVDALSRHGGAQRIAGVYGNAKAKNVVLFIGDGMGDSEITVARDYLHGANGSFDGLDRIGQPNLNAGIENGTGQYTTFSLGGSSSDGRYPKAGGVNENPGVVTPVTDSSASGSSWATGTKTYNNAVDVDIDGNPQLNLVELAKAKGMATGNVTTAEIQDATPAVLESHSTERSCYGPQGKTDGTSNNADKQCRAEQLKENGGIGSISEQLLDTRADVTIGGGAKYFRQTAQGGAYAGKTLWDQAAERGFQTVENDVDAFAALEYQEDHPVLALLGDGNLPTQFNETRALSQKATEERGPIQCSVNDAWLGNATAAGNTASLADMASKALDLLQANPKSEANGFFLQVEGASIDKQDHAANACGQIGETDDLDKAIAAVLDRVDLSDTLVIVTADHAHTSQIVSDPPAYALSTILQSPVDGARIVVSYGTATAADPDATDPSKGYDDGGMEHTGTQLRIAASGPGASRVTGLTDQTDNFYTIAAALGLAADAETQQGLSDGATVTMRRTDDGHYVADAAGFDGDAVLSWSLADKTSGTVVAASEDATPVSGVRVATAQTTSVAMPDDFTPVEGGSYTLTVTGRQSGRAVSVDFGAGTDGSADHKPGDGDHAGDGDQTIASGTVNKPAAPLGHTGAAVTGALAAALALACGAMTVRYARRRR